MRLAKVIGNVWSTIESSSLDEFKLMQVEAIDNKKDRYIATDVIGAGIGETVITVGGSSARAGISQSLPVDATIIAIVDKEEVEEKKTM